MGRRSALRRDACDARNVVVRGGAVASYSKVESVRSYQQLGLLSRAWVAPDRNAVHGLVRAETL